MTLQGATRVVHDRVVAEEDGRHGDDPQQRHRRHDDGAELEGTERTIMKEREITKWIRNMFETFTRLESSLAVGPRRYTNVFE